MKIFKTTSRRDFLVKSTKLGTLVTAGSVLASCRTGNRINLDSLTELSASDAIDSMVRGDIKAEDYALALLDQTEKLETLNAFRILSPEIVLEEAFAADQRRSSGMALGPLHGLPIPVKDSVNTADFPTSYGTAILRNNRPKSDAGILPPLLNAGAFVMGKTNIHELSLGWTSMNEAFGAVHNPYDISRVPGGSSGGSAVAVAARMAPLAIAEDTLGSIRIPATMCGLSGLRTTYGRYPADGIMPLSTSGFDQVGALARTVEDLALFDSVVTGDYSTLPDIDLRGVRVGVSEYFFTDLDSEVERVALTALERLRDAGVIIVQTDVSEDIKAAHDAAFTLNMFEIEPAISRFLEEQEINITFDEIVDQVGKNLKGIFEIPPPPRAAYDAAIIQQQQTQNAVRAHFIDNNIAALAFPPIMIPPQKIEDDGSIIINGEIVPNITTMGRNIALSSVASLSSLVLPAGMTTSALPVGLEFDSLPGTDRQLLALGLSLQRALGRIEAPLV